MTETGQSKENRRVRYTRMALRESLLALLQQYPISKITVSRICEQADVNRSTFYLYYKDAYDLLEKIESELYDELSQAIAKSSDMMPNSDILKRVYEIIYKNRDLCRVLFGEYGDKEFMKKVGSLHRERMLQEWKKLYGSIDDTLLDYLYAFSAYTNIGIMDRWIARDFQETPNQLAQMVSRLLLSGVSTYLAKR